MIKKKTFQNQEVDDSQMEQLHLVDILSNEFKKINMPSYIFEFVKLLFFKGKQIKNY